MEKTEFTLTDEHGEKVPCSIEGNLLKIYTNTTDLLAIKELLWFQDPTKFSEAIDRIIVFIGQILSLLIQAEVYDDIDKKFMISPGTEDIFELSELSRILRIMQIEK